MADSTYNLWMEAYPLPEKEEEEPLDYEENGEPIPPPEEPSELDLLK